MSKYLSFTLSLLLVLTISSAGVLANESQTSIPENSGRLQVTGQAVIKAAPDLVRIVLGVETASNSAETATTENAERMARVLEALKNLGLTNAEVSTSGFNIYSYDETLGWNTPDQTTVTTYQVQNRINITTKNLDQAGQIVDTAVKAGANQVQGVSFDLAEKQDLQLQALRTAIKQARSKAEVMAESAGLSLGGIVSLNEEYGSYAPQREAMLMRSADYDMAAPPTSISPGEIEISAQVNMIFWF